MRNGKKRMLLWIFIGSLVVAASVIAGVLLCQNEEADGTIDTEEEVQAVLIPTITTAFKAVDLSGEETPAFF